MKNAVISVFVFLYLTGCASQQPLIAENKQSLPRPESLSPEADDKYEVLAYELEFNPETGEIKYTLPGPALGRIRIGLQPGGPVIRTLFDWEYRDAGSHVEIWDRKDASGKIDYTGNPKLSVLLHFVKTDSPLNKIRKSPDFSINFPESASSADGEVILREGIPVRVVLSNTSKEWLRKTRYEIAVYLDNVFLIEDEEANDPYTYWLRTRDINNGMHIITVNVVGYQGEVGAKSIPVLISN